jgi:hypothetical protein
MSEKKENLLLPDGTIALPPKIYFGGSVTYTFKIARMAISHKWCQEQFGFVPEGMENLDDLNDEEEE